MKTRRGTYLKDFDIPHPILEGNRDTIILQNLLGYQTYLLCIVGFLHHKGLWINSDSTLHSYIVEPLLLFGDLL